MNTYELHIPAIVSNWIEPLLWVLFAMVLLWAIFTTLNYFRRRAYNITPTESTTAGGIKPDFLKIDRAGREEQIKRGRLFDAQEVPPDQPTGYEKARSWARIIAIFIAVSSFISAVVFAFLRIESIEALWQRFSVWERFLTIVQEYPVGFGLAVIIVLHAFARMVVTIWRPFGKS